MCVRAQQLIPTHAYPVVGTRDGDILAELLVQLPGVCVVYFRVSVRALRVCVCVCVCVCVHAHACVRVRVRVDEIINAVTTA